ncbi:hypothetical protein RchiOBHm_Chr2g0093181 [Rosa chinensis]|uniref:Uncharacterized protein n=1 Tax=Rosa chinensis TaxID=74649 RepID=A0A2P6Q370_ROSCH|nr:hypothetical protein RchiOBHm_Chr5g0004661 [Rosa chinensis]PRQ46825.1 hypothetical protein RchiOBHm_Chr2g0093181 [Rosa chinensis]
MGRTPALSLPLSASTSTPSLTKTPTSMGKQEASVSVEFIMKIQVKLFF